MDEHILRGFCQKCGLVVELNSYKEKQWIVHCNPTRNSFCEPDAVWFLSPKQMKMIENYFYTEQKNDSKFYWESLSDYCHDRANYYTIDYAKLLKDNPFLVAKILKDAEGKK